MVTDARAVAACAFALALIAAPAVYGTGDAKAGEAIYSRCAACHALGHDRAGPRHCRLFGRRAGTRPGFEYSAAMKQSGIVWNEATLDRFLADPLKTVPGTAMGYAGIEDSKERTDLIAYLKEAGSKPTCDKVH